MPPNPVMPAKLKEFCRHVFAATVGTKAPNCAIKLVFGHKLEGLEVIKSVTFSGQKIHPSEAGKIINEGKDVLRRRRTVNRTAEIGVEEFQRSGGPGTRVLGNFLAMMLCQGTSVTDPLDSGKNGETSYQ